MAVPAHDERDHEFARKYGLPIVEVIAPTGGGGSDVQNAAYTDDGVASYGRAVADVADGTPSAEARSRIVAWLARNGKGSAKVTYRLRDWVFSRQRYWGEPIPIYFPVTTTGDPRTPGTPFTIHYDQPIAVDDRELPLCLPDLEDFKPGNDPAGPLARAASWRVFQKDDRWFARETNTMPQWAGSKAGTTSGISIPGTTANPGALKATPSGCRWTSTWEEESTPFCIFSTRASGTRCSSTWAS